MDAEEVARCWEANADSWSRQARAGYDIYRDALNTPAFLAMLPPVAGLDGLDIGCGEGTNTRALAGLGARMQAIDIAPTFIRHAEAAEAADPRGIRFRTGDAMALPYPDAAFDFATAFMCLMDMPDQGRALQEAKRVLRPGGFLQFSILHPCFAPPHRKVLREADGRVRAIEVGDYFATGSHAEDRWFSTLPAAERGLVAPFRVPYFHRTLSDWVGLILGAGFAIEAFGEPSADAALAQAVPVVADTRVAPLFLHVRAVNP
jgi:SAM-dependent methyltransferase